MTWSENPSAAERAARGLRPRRLRPFVRKEVPWHLRYRKLGRKKNIFLAIYIGLNVRTSSARFIFKNWARGKDMWLLLGLQFVFNALATKLILSPFSSYVVRRTPHATHFYLFIFFFLLIMLSIALYIFFPIFFCCKKVKT